MKFSLAFVLLLATAASSAPQKTDQPEIRIPDLERQIHDEINKERKKAGVAPLQFDDRLAKIARAHSADMAKRNFSARPSVK